MLAIHIFTDVLYWSNHLLFLVYWEFLSIMDLIVSSFFFAYIYCVDHMCFGEGNGNPLQCSCLENPRDRGAWWAAVYGVTQSQTRLKWLSSSSICVYSYFILLKRWIILIHIGILNQAFLIMIYYDILSFYMYCYVWLNDILLILRIFASMLMRDIL